MNFSSPEMITFNTFFLKKYSYSGGNLQSLKNKKKLLYFSKKKFFPHFEITADKALKFLIRKNDC